MVTPQTSPPRMKPWATRDANRVLISPNQEGGCPESCSVPASTWSAAALLVTPHLLLEVNVLHIGAVLFHRADHFDGHALLREQREQAFRRLPGLFKGALVAKDLDRSIC